MNSFKRGKKDQSLQAFMPDCDWSLFAPLEAVHLSFSFNP